MKAYFYGYLTIRFFILTLSSFLKNFIPTIKDRYLFEIKNQTDTGCVSFYKSDNKAQIAFFVSSEGELEQVKTLIHYYLAKGELVEIIFTSKSVENKVFALYKEYPNSMRYLRYPFLSFSYSFLKQWITSPKIVCVRYDIFPEMIELIKTKTSILVSATKSYQHRQSLFIQSYYNYCFTLFDMILWADEVKDQSNNGIHKVVDMRSFQIIDRLSKSDEVIKQKGLNEFVRFIQDQNIRVIWGSFWKEELKAFNKNFKLKVQKVVLAPHLLDDKNLNEIKEQLEQLNFKVQTVDQNFKIEESTADIYILKVKGVLCEIYQFFDEAIVGGGHGKSVHSVLEPYLAGCRVWHGPIYFRSTEHRYIKNTEPSRINVVDRLESYFDQITQSKYYNSKPSYTSNEDRAILEDIYRL